VAHDGKAASAAFFYGGTKQDKLSKAAKSKFMPLGLIRSVLGPPEIFRNSHFFTLYEGGMMGRWRLLEMSGSAGPAGEMEPDNSCMGTGVPANFD
jgi:hypothetical protein